MHYYNWWLFSYMLLIWAYVFHGDQSAENASFRQWHWLSDNSKRVSIPDQPILGFSILVYFISVYIRRHAMKELSMLYEIKIIQGRDLNDVNRKKNASWLPTWVDQRIASVPFEYYWSIWADMMKHAANSPNKRACAPFQYNERAFVYTDFHYKEKTFVPW